MSTMNSVRVAFRAFRDDRDGPPLWVIAIIVVAAVGIVVGLADLHLLPTFSADDAGSVLFEQG